jgi:hypothetical protein
VALALLDDLDVPRAVAITKRQAARCCATWWRSSASPEALTALEEN